MHPSTRYSGTLAGGLVTSQGTAKGTQGREHVCPWKRQDWLSLAWLSWRQAKPQSRCEHLLCLMSRALIFRGAMGESAGLSVSISSLGEKVFLNFQHGGGVGYTTHTSPASKNSTGDPGYHMLGGSTRPTQSSQSSLGWCHGPSRSICMRVSGCWLLLKGSA